MQFKPALLALASALALQTLQPAQALQVVDVGAFTVTYDESSALGFLSGWYTSLGQQGFEWSIPSSVLVTSATGGSASFVLPAFKIEVNPGWILTGNIAGFMGNLVYNLVGAGSSVSASVSGNVSLNGGAALPVGGALTQTATGGVPGVFETGYVAGSQSGDAGPFTSFEFSGGLLTLTATAPVNSFASITAQPQNKMKFDVAVAEVPEPGALALMLGGLGFVGLALTRRRATR